MKNILKVPKRLLYLQPDLKLFFFIWAAHEMFLNKKRFLQKVNDSVAQLVEHYTFNVGVLGSNPSGITDRLIKVKQSRSSFNTRAVFCFFAYQTKSKQLKLFVKFF